MIQVIVAGSSSFLTALQNIDLFRSGCFHICSITHTKESLFSWISNFPGSKIRKRCVTCGRKTPAHGLFP